MPVQTDSNELWLEGLRHARRPRSVNNVCHGTGWGMAADMSHPYPPESLWDGTQPSIPCIIVRMCFFQHPVLCIQKSCIYFLSPLKQGCTYKSALSPANPVLVEQSTKPKSHSHRIYCPLCFRALNNPRLLLFLEKQQHSTCEFHFRILVLLLFLGLFLSSCTY